MGEGWFENRIWLAKLSDVGRLYRYSSRVLNADKTGAQFYPKLKKCVIMCDHKTKIKFNSNKKKGNFYKWIKNEKKNQLQINQS